MPAEHERSPLEVAAQLWCLPEHGKKEMDAKLAESISEEIAREQRLTDNWYDTAAQHFRNEEYYRGLVVKIGEMLGDEAYVSDDGSKQDSVLCAKVPELVAKLVATPLGA